MKHGWLPTDAAAHGPQLDRELLLALCILFGIAAFAHLVLFLALTIRRRRQQIHPIGYELLPLLAMTSLFLWLSVHAEGLWSRTRYAGADPAAMQVEVVGEQFVWYYRYPGPDGRFGKTSPLSIDAGAGNPLGLDPEDAASHDDRVSSELVLPIHREVDLRLRSIDVIHGFSVPELRIKQNAVPGQVFHIHFNATRLGRYAVLCTQVCGLGHYRMASTVRVVSEQEYQKWSAAR